MSRKNKYAPFVKDYVDYMLRGNVVSIAVERKNVYGLINAIEEGSPVGKIMYRYENLTGEERLISWIVIPRFVLDDEFTFHVSNIWPITRLATPSQPTLHHARKWRRGEFKQYNLLPLSEFKKLVPHICDEVWNRERTLANFFGK